MNHKTTTAATVAAATLIATLALAGCGAGGARTADATMGRHAASPAQPPATPTSDIDDAVNTFVTALDRLGIQHTAPVRSSVGLSGAKARFDITVDGYDAGINVFPDAQIMATWGKVSDQLGGIYVAHGTAVLTLNSSEGIADSAAIAPKIAAAVGGEAHGV